MQISAQEVNELRKQTGAGLMDCKKALSEANGDFDAAIDYLRKKGQKVSALRAGKEANEGVAMAITNDDATIGVIVKLSCETDFVAKNEDFINSAKQFAEKGLETKVNSLDELLNQQIDGVTLTDKVNELVGSINENIKISAYELVEATGVVAYNHANYKIGVLVALTVPATDVVEKAGKDVAMQVAAMNPVAVDKDQVDSSVVEREMEIGREQARQEGKPENIIDKIAAGKLEKFYKENTLLNQPYVKDGSKTVAQYLKEVNKDLTVKDFKRVS